MSVSNVDLGFDQLETAIRGKEFGYRPIIVSGYSGSGKNTVAQAVLECSKRFALSTGRFTDRPIRPGEIQGVDGYFINSDEFASKLDAGSFIYAYKKMTYGGVSYGFSREIINSELSSSNLFLVGGELETSIRLMESLESEIVSGNIVSAKPIILFVNRQLNSIIDSIRSRQADEMEKERRIKHVEKVWEDVPKGLTDRVVLFQNDTPIAVDGVRLILKSLCDRVVTAA